MLRHRLRIGAGCVALLVGITLAAGCNRTSVVYVTNETGTAWDNLCIRETFGDYEPTQECYGAVANGEKVTTVTFNGPSSDTYYAFEVDVTENQTDHLLDYNAAQLRSANLNLVVTAGDLTAAQ